MSAALPHAGGAYSFARTSMGPWGGYITGLAENMEYVLTPAVIVVGIGGYLGLHLRRLERVGSAVVGAVLCACFVALNIWGVEMTFQVSVVVTLMAMAVLARLLDRRRAALRSGALGDAVLSAGRGKLARRAWWSCRLRCGCIWASSSFRWRPRRATRPERDLPRGILSGLVTLVAISVLTVVMSAGIAPGVAKVAASNEPLFLGFQTIFGAGIADARAGAAGLYRAVASFHTIIFAYGRQIYSLSRAGYFPTWLSVTHGAAQDAASGADCRRGAGLRGGAGDPSGAARQPGGRGVAEHGGVRRGTGVCAADGVVPGAALAVSRG